MSSVDVRLVTAAAFFAAIMTACASATPTAAPRVEPTLTLPPLPALQPDLVAEGQQVYAQHCASCHGANLQGQSNWKQPLPSGKYPAPPHDDSGHTWHHPDALLKQIIVEGGNGTNGQIPSDMPAFGAVLNERQTDAVLEFIKSRWSAQSREYQWLMTHQQSQH
jgi:mono/diheme cytochrome c family protein